MINATLRKKHCKYDSTSGIKIKIFLFEKKTVGDEAVDQNKHL